MSCLAVPRGRPHEVGCEGLYAAPDGLILGSSPRMTRGSVGLTLVQKTPLDGAVIVSTPQEVALADARRAHTLFQKVETPTLGLIENMTGAVFGRGGAEAEADRLGIPYLGDLPLDAALREGGDAGVPIVVSDPDGDIARRFGRFAGQITAVLFPDPAI